MRDNRKFVMVTFSLVGIFFLVFLIFPLLTIFYQAFVADSTLNLTNFKQLISNSTIQASFIDSLTISFQTSLLATVIGFVFAYCVNFTNVLKAYKRLINTLIVLPMLVPTIVYGFAIIYSFGKQGIITRLLGFQLFDIYSTQGLILGFLIYTVPIAYLLFNNAMGYLDHQYFIVSDIMGDSKLRRFWVTIISPLITTIAISIVQTFFLTFTDFGIPASLAGSKNLMATALYNQMIGSVPDFANGSILALMMLLPAILSALLLFRLKRFEIRYDKRRTFLISRNRIRDSFNFLLTAGYLLITVATFCSFLIVPFVTNYPYNLTLTFEHIKSVLSNSDLIATYLNTLEMSMLTSILGIILAYTCALLVKRSILHPLLRRSIEGLSQLTIAIPSMVLGLAFIFAFSQTALHYTLTILIIVNLVHFFATPFNLASQALEKMSDHYEQTATLLGDSYLKLLVRVIIPNSKQTLVDMFSYLFTNAMVTISAIIFLVGTHTSTMTTKIKELQHFNKFDDIFILALLLLGTNLIVKYLLYLMFSRHKLTFKQVLKIRKPATLQVKKGA
ncbi:phosphonate ABC transporter permease [Bacilli bacterium]|nr:phosphonate ABC transporter permease [Bacilli bacterium]GHU40792.1 phosphonate ABC transporter permease [Bacilli bacterium]GHU45102.1 phosphonate ABC transporter permease [Bacilli bacterium]